jgi:pimeloyl-ACP methyl ester carboxylesterase
MLALHAELDALPQQPAHRGHPRHWIVRAKRALDAFGHARPDAAGFFRRANPYPKPFRHIWLRTEDGVDVAAWYGPPPGETSETSRRRSTAKPAAGTAAGRPKTPKASGGAAAVIDPDAPKFGLIIVPGMFSTKDDTIHKRRAIRIWRHWHIPVIAIDMRAFGESKGIATGGWKEALDIHAAARFLVEEAGVERVGVIAESMGGAAMLNALAHDAQGGTNFLRGGALCFSAFVDVRDAVLHISVEPPKDDPFHIQWTAFSRMLRYRSHGAYDNFRDYLGDAARVNGFDGFDELVEVANPKWKTHLIDQPTLLVHAIDDPVVPVRHARRMERYARDRENIQVITTAWGGHTHFEGMDPYWFWEVTRRFFGAVNEVELPQIST